MCRQHQLVLASLCVAAAWIAGAGTGAAAPARASQKGASSCGVVTVAAASDLSYAMEELARAFEAQSGCTVRVSTGSSGNFLTQMENGAPFDVFFSADIAYPKRFEEKGLAAAGSTYLYGIGKIVLWTRNDSRVDVGKGLGALRDPAVRRIAIANPAHAPYGRAAEEALRKAGVYEAVKDRLVLGENISQTAEFAESGNADAGIVALSLVKSPALAGKGRSAPIPDDLYTPIEQGAVVLLRAPNANGARLFLDYVKQPAGAMILERYGFVLPAGAKSSDGRKP